MGCPNQELHAAAGAAITGNESCPHAAAEATEAAAPEAAEASMVAPAVKREAEEDWGKERWR